MTRELERNIAILLCDAAGLKMTRELERNIAILQ